MKLFIDTSNKKIILALIKNDLIIDFFIEDTNNDIVKNSLAIIEKFLTKNKTRLGLIKKYMITIGPGSFTGVKVALNIIRTVDMVNSIDSIETIETFDLITNSTNNKTAIKFGKSKYYLKYNKKIKIITHEKLKEIEKVNIGYDNFTSELLQEKINNKEFKLLDNLNKVKIKYISDY